MGKKEQRKWEREEVVILISEYFRTKGMRSDIIDENFHRISSILRMREMKMTGKPVDETFRDYSGVRMQSSRIRCLDPDTNYSGMTGTKLQKQVFEEYIDKQEKINNEAKMIINKFE